MQVIKQETSGGTVEEVAFRRGEAEDETTFKTAVKTWLTTEGSITTRDQLIDKMISADAFRIAVSFPAP